MKYLTTYIRRQGEGGSSLLLQHFLCRRVPVCLMCLCTWDAAGEEEDGRYLTGELRRWCRGFPWHRAARNPERWMERAEAELAETLRRCLAEIERGTETLRRCSVEIDGRAVALPGAKEVSRSERAGQRRASLDIKWRVVLCVGEELLALGDGQRLCLLSTYFGRGAARLLAGSFRGRMEPGVGLLLATEDVWSGLDRTALEEVICPEALETEEQAKRRLRELTRSGEKGASEGELGIPAAVLLVTERKYEKNF